MKKPTFRTMVFLVVMALTGPGGAWAQEWPAVLAEGADGAGSGTPEGSGSNGAAGVTQAGAEGATAGAEGAAAPPEAAGEPSLENALNPRQFQGAVVKDVKVELQGPYRLKDLRDVVVVSVGEPLSLRDVSRSIELIYRLGAIDDVVAEGEAVPGGVRVRFRVWPATVVRNVRFSGNRLVSDQKLREQLTLRSGSVYSWLDARAQAARLARFYQTQGFMQATVAPETRRVRRRLQMDVLFRVSEGQQLRIREVRFEGNEVFSPRMLQQVTGLEEGRRFRPSDLEDRRKALLDHYRDTRHLGARVKASLEYGEKKEWVAIRFEIEEGPEIRLEFYQVRLPGNGPLDGLIARKVYQAITRLRKDGQPRRVSLFRRRELIELLELDTEQQFSAGFAEEAAERIQAALIQEGFNGPKVTQERVLSDGGNKTTFKFVIDPGRRVRIQKVSFQGNQFFDTQLLTEVFSEAMGRFAPTGIFTEEAFDQALPLMSEYYRSQGFLEVRITPAWREQDSALGARVNIDLRIEEGPRTLVKEVQVVGNVEIAETELRPLLMITPDSPYDPARVRQTVDKIKALYASRGYVFAQVFPSREARPETPTDVTVKLEIDEGPQARFGEVIVRGARRTRPAVIARELTLKPGDVYVPERIEESKRRLSETGLFQKAPIYPVAGERIRDMVVEVQERDARTISLSGGVLLNGLELSLDAARFDASLELAHYNLWGLGHRLSGRLELASSYLPAFQERGQAQPLFPDYLLQVGQDLQEYLNNATSRRIVLSYQSPYFLGLRLNSTGSITLFERQRLTSYLLHRNSADWTFSTRDLGTRTKAYLQLQATVRRPDSDETEEKIQLWDIDRQQRLLLQANTVFLYDRRDNRLDPSRGYLLSLQTELGQAYGCGDTWEGLTLSNCGGGQPLPTEAYARFSGSGSMLLPVTRWLHLEGRVQGGYVIPFASEDGAVPMEKRFYLGGAGTVRGFSQDSLGPVRFREKTLPQEVVSGWTAVPTGGNASLSYSAELQFPLNWISDWFDGVELAVFHDGGNVFWTGKSLERFNEAVQTDMQTDTFLDQVPSSCQALYSYQKLRGSVGAGLRYRTSIGPIRLDVGFPIQRVCTELEKSWALHFSIGLF